MSVKRLLSTLFLVAVLLGALLAAPALAQPRAGDCMVGPGLGATLLFPYFEVTPLAPAGTTTLISINNGLSAPTLARVVLWTDWGVPTLAFDLFLPGFDVQTINLYDLFRGVIPSTGNGLDLSGWPFCTSLTPVHSNPVLTSLEIDQLRAFHTGNKGPIHSGCAAYAHGDGLARGYVTVDAVDECSGVEAITPLFTPANTAYPYFADGGGAAGIAKVDNTLWGDHVIVDFAGNFAQGSEAIALWADPGHFSGTDIFTFYGRFSGWDGRDDRVPLPYRWDQRFFNGGPFAGGASLVVWRSPNSAEASPVTCGTAPAWWPLTATLGAMDEQAANYATLDPTACHLATQRLDVTSMAIPYAFGWIQLDSGLSQTWVQPTLTAGGRFSAAFQGIPVEFLCDRQPPP